MATQKATKKKQENSDVKDNMYVAALSYIGILCFIPLFLKRDSAFAQSHAKQGLILFILEIAGMLLPFLFPLLLIVFIITSAYGIKVTLEGKEWEIPYIGKYADKLNI